jgi:hypothetical protein
MKKTIKSLIALLALSAIFLPYLEAQEVVIAKFSEDAWKVEAQKSEFTTVKGKECLYLEHGAAHLIGSNFKMGVIDYDVMFQQGRKFAGIQFRIQDAGN